MSAAVQEHDLETVREQAAQRARQLGWPTPEMEAWRYTNVAPIERVEWATGVDRRVPLGGSPFAVASFRGRAFAELVFVNGRLADATGGASGVDIIPIAEAASHPAFERHYARYADYQRHFFTALNTAHAQDGALIAVADGARPEGFVHLLFIGQGDGVWSHPRNLIVAGRNAEINVVETYVGQGNYFTNSVTEIVAGDGAAVDYSRIERESTEAFHVGTVQIHQERSATVAAHTIAIGGALVRSEVKAALAGEGASLTLDGLFLLRDRQHIDNHTVIDHVKPHCDSLELYKGILDGKSRGIFDGLIIVRPDAQKTNSRQVNRNLLLSESAIVDSKPTLEIHNDDVKCNHGSTIGQLDAEAMFYLRARGIGEEEARKLPPEEEVA